MEIKVKPKPKLNVKDSIKQKSLIFKKIKTKLEISFNLDDVSFDYKVNFDANYQKSIPLKQRINSFKFSATKKF